MFQVFKNAQGSIILRVKIINAASPSGAGLTGLLFSSSGLIISTIADNEATATAYTAAGSTTETITTLGTYAAPTATKCRFKEVDATNHPGVYEIQFADARFAVANAKSLLVSIQGSASNIQQTDFVVQLVTDDPYILAENKIWDALRASHVVIGSFGRAQRVVFGTAQGDGTGSDTLQLAAGQVTADNCFNGVGNEHIVAIVAGAGAGQQRAILDSDQSDNEIQIDGGNWETPVDATSVYVIFAN